MGDVDTFLTILYVTVDDFCKHQSLPEPAPGPKASLSASEVITLVIFSQWGRFRSERDFYHYATKRLRPAFPTLPRRSQFNRLTRRHYETLATCSHHLVELLQGQRCSYEALDSSGVPTRSAKRRGAGWLAGQADIGWSNRLGWYEGFHLLLSVNPAGVITGFSFAPASVKDQTLAEDFFDFRHTPHTRLPTLGEPALGWYVADKGFAGQAAGQRWREPYGAWVVCPPQRNSRNPWPKAWRRWLDSTHVMSNIAVLTRLGLFCETVRVFLLAVSREHPGLGEGIGDGLAQRYLKETGEASRYEDARSGEGRRRLSVCARDVYRLVDRFRGTAVAKMEEYGLLERLLHEQCHVGRHRDGRPGADDDDAEEGKVPVALREPKEVRSSSMQTPHDPEVTYSGHKGKGYEVQVSETCEEGNAVQMITHVEVTPSSGGDAGVTVGVIDRLRERGIGPSELWCDTSYGSGHNGWEAERRGTELVSPVGGRAPAEADRGDRPVKLTAADFDIDVTARGLRCVLRDMRLCPSTGMKRLPSEWRCTSPGRCVSPARCVPGVL